jgi:dihydrofolate reductase
VTVTPGPVLELAATLRDGEGTAWLVGGGELFAAFAAAGLVDLWIVTVIPVMLGGGVPLLPTGGEAYQRLELAETRTLPGGLVQLHYSPQR